MSFLTHLLSFVLLMKGGAMIPEAWCKEVLQHGALVQDSFGQLYVMDNWKLRRFTYRYLKQWYATGVAPVCVMKPSESLDYQMGEDIRFRPDQDLQMPMFLKINGEEDFYLWYRGRIHLMRVPVNDLRIGDNRVYSMSKLTLESLPKGGSVTASMILEGTVIYYNSDTYVHTRFGLRLVRKTDLKRFDLYPMAPLRVSHSVFRRMHLWRPLRFITLDPMPDNILLRGSHPQRIYFLKGGKRYYLWSQEAFFRHGFSGKVIKRISDDELYLIPYGGNLY